MNKRICPTCLKNEAEEGYKRCKGCRERITAKFLQADKNVAGRKVLNSVHTMQFAEFCKYIADHEEHVSAKGAAAAVRLTLDYIKHALCDGFNLKLAGFGTLGTSYVAAKSNDFCSDYLKVAFYPLRKLKKAVKQEANIQKAKERKEQKQKHEEEKKARREKFI
jgi:nucleoid DNA-binding protein